MIGMPGLIELESIEENIALCKALSLDFIELNMNLPRYNHEIDLKTIKSCLEAAQIKVSLHLSETFDPFELDPIMRSAHMASFKRGVEIARSLDAFLINMHLSKGIHFSLPDQKVHLYEVYKEAYLKHVASFIEIVEQEGIQLCIENTGIHDMNFIREASDLLLQSKHIGLTYDIGHDITSGYKDFSYYDLHKHEIKHYHIHDGTENKNHLSLFTGDLDIMSFVEKARSQDASIVIEVKSEKDLIDSVTKLGENYETLFNETWTNRMEFSR